MARSAAVPSSALSRPRHCRRPRRSVLVLFLETTTSVALTSLPALVDAARSWDSLVPMTHRGMHHSSKGGEKGPLVDAGDNARLVNAMESNPFLPFEDDIRVTSTTTTTLTTTSTTTRPVKKTSTPTFRPSSRPSSQPLVETDEPTIRPTTLRPTSARPTSVPTERPTPEFWAALDDDGDCSSESNSTKCGPCVGSCASDDDCLDGLVCFRFQYDDGTDTDALDLTVPGCDGTARNHRRTYCVLPEGAWANGWRFPTSRPTKVPSTSPSLHPTDDPTFRPTSYPTDEPTRSPVSPKPTYAPLPAEFYSSDNECDDDHFSKCDRCMGPCKRDSDCHDGLRCMDRDSSNSNKRNRAVPGCVGEAVSGVSYCYLDPDDASDLGGWAAPTPTSNPTSVPTIAPTISLHPTISQHPSSNPTSRPTRQPARATDSFKLRLWWQKGYYWQQSWKETDWCVEKTSGSILEIQDCSNSDSDQKFVEYGGTLRPSKSFDKCFTKEGNDVTLRDCDGKLGNANQQWVLDVGTGYTARNNNDRPEVISPTYGKRRAYDVLMQEEKFEIHPKSNLAKCVTNHHQPRNGELLIIQDCIYPRRSDTSFWRLD